MYGNLVDHAGAHPPERWPDGRGICVHTSRHGLSRHLQEQLASLADQTGCGGRQGNPETNVWPDPRIWTQEGAISASGAVLWNPLGLTCREPTWRLLGGGSPLCAVYASVLWQQEFGGLGPGGCGLYGAEFSPVPGTGCLPVRGALCAREHQRRRQVAPAQRCIPGSRYEFGFQSFRAMAINIARLM